MRAEYKGLGIFNTFYKGGSQNIYFDEHDSNLYWGDWLYKSSEYNRLDGYIYFLKTDAVNLKFVFSFHSVNSSRYYSQQLYATFDLDNLKNKKQGKKYQYLWDHWFKK
jgi:hypothetical protein